MLILTSKHNFNIKWPIFVCFTIRVCFENCCFSWTLSFSFLVAWKHLCTLPNNTEMLRIECVCVWTVSTFCTVVGFKKELLHRITVRYEATRDKIKSAKVGHRAVCGWFLYKSFRFDWITKVHGEVYFFFPSRTRGSIANIIYVKTLLFPLIFLVSRRCLYKNVVKGK